jgi:hypothetical protein
MSDDFVQLPVPTKWVNEIYKRLVELEASERTAQTEPGLFSENVEDQYRRMFTDSHIRHRELLNFLAAHPDEWISTSEVADALQLESGPRGAGGMFGAFGRRANNRYGGRTPWKKAWNASTGENFYMMDSDIARIISQVSSDIDLDEF